MTETAKKSKAKTRVFVLWAASYTGATWISFVLGSHQQVFSLGNIKKALTGLHNDPAKTCVVHRENCAFWPAFVKEWNPDENLLVQLSNYVGNKCIVVNNPRLRGGRFVINDSRLQLVQFAIQRDLRALAASYMRKNPGAGIESTIQEYLLTAARTMETDVRRKNVIVIDHGIASANHNYLLDKLRQGTGLDYDTNNLRFWEHDYHVVSSNAGTVGTVRAYQNMNESHRQTYYDDFVKRLRNSNNVDVSFTDQRWREELSRYDLFVIDKCVGDINQRLGYSRDEFTPDEINQFSFQLEKKFSEGDFSGIQQHLSLKKNIFGRLILGTKRKLRTLLENFA